MRRAVVHVGMPRSGTTTFQRILSRWRPELLRAGILYPSLGPAGQPAPHLSHQPLGEALDGRRPASDKAAMLRRLDDELAATQAEVVLLSYESLCLIPPARAVPTTLAEALQRRGFAMTVLATIKPPAEHLNSTYTWRTQFLREQRSFAGFVRAEMTHRQLDLGTLLQPWRAAAQGRLIVVPTRDPRSAAPLVTRILDAVGLLPRVAGLLTPEDTGLVDNRSPGPLVVEAARHLRQGGAHLALPAATAREATRFMEDMARSRGLDAAVFNGLDPALRAAIDTRWAPANDRFARLVWGEPWSARVAAGPERPVNEIARTRDAASVAEVDRLLASVCDRFGLRLRPSPGLALRNWLALATSHLGRQLRLG